MVGKRKKEEQPQRRPPDLPKSIDDLTLLTEIATGEPMEESRLVGADFGGRKISGLTAKYSVFEEVSFAGCDIPSPRLRDVRLIKCDLSNATLRGFEATRVEFIDCRLTGMIATECRWQEVLMENCDGRYAQLTAGRIHTCEFKASNLSEADFQSADLESTIFARATLSRADLSHSKLRNTDLRGAEIDGIVVGKEDVRGAIVSPTQAMELTRLLGLVIK